MAPGVGVAFPGQTSDEVQTWIQAHPTLRPAPGEKLLIRKTDTPARRFSFQASPLQVGRAAPGPGGGIIRTEEISLFDMVNGVTRARLEESLRAIYGAQIYDDYTRAGVVYAYPDPATVGKATNRDTPLLSGLTGEVREGDRYAYWLELARRPNGVTYTGKMVVFLRDDIPKLAAELKTR